VQLLVSTVAEWVIPSRACTQEASFAAIQQWKWFIEAYDPEVMMCVANNKQVSFSFFANHGAPINIKCF
jgi:hypothetical protein